MNSNTFTYKLHQITMFDSIQRLVCFVVVVVFHLIQHVTLIPQLMSQCLQFLHRLGIAFVDLAGSGAPRCRQRSKLYSWFPLTSCSGVRGPGGPSRKCSCCVRKSLTQVGGKMVRGHVNANASFCLLMEHDGACFC